MQQNKLTVEVKGISFANRGAELMLSAVKEQFMRRGIDAHIVVEPNGNYIRRCRYEVWQKPQLILKRVNVLKPLAWLPKSLRRRLGIITDSEIDVVLDASGFSYGDFWPHKVAWDRLAKPIKQLKRRGVPVIVLPQALGPFTHTASAKPFRRILKYADLIFARDAQSLSYARALSCRSDNLFYCPDFTCLVAPQGIPELTPPKNAVCFITNEKMAATAERKQAYLDWMISLVQATLRSGHQAYFVNHGGSADATLAQHIIASVGAPVALLEAENAKQTKWLIGQARVVVGSRYHAVVSALSQRIPVVATSWSHKYQALLNDYESSESLFACDETDAASARLNKLLSDNALYEREQQKLQICAEQQKSLSEAMWQQVFELLEDQKL
ncbi:polysaccharide pyruvyl transferase family protein [Pseudidiomarina insulisalsae]|uniref:Polysaccharide pyruvyl transferase domain-containing protein n=1 Tax=Pseudidiomarina insulisalsae TaxID=575789 RepID=A0A432YNT9_9GAMM|nr:polysaccharide pyruvyl transferase family protein [Pseudidiomarina insulisalsae]RUO62614.1 hypothetical protein CWI71_04055 [Pseudidiomarina insulisalsae]